MTAEKGKKGIPIWVNILLGLLILAAVAAMVFIFIETSFSFKKSTNNMQRPEVTVQEQDSIWDVTFPADDTVVKQVEATAVTETPAESEETAGEYIFADSNTRYLEEAEIKALSQEEMRLARNEIYARHGRIFNDEALNEYFQTKSWYAPLYSAEEMDEMGDAIFNEYEYHNKNLIAEIEEELGYR